MSFLTSVSWVLPITKKLTKKKDKPKMESWKSLFIFLFFVEEIIDK
jgi:hypothetical protein